MWRYRSWLGTMGKKDRGVHKLYHSFLLKCPWYLWSTWAGKTLFTLFQSFNSFTVFKLCFVQTNIHFPPVSSVSSSLFCLKKHQIGSFSQYIALIWKLVFLYPAPNLIQTTHFISCYWYISKDFFCQPSGVKGSLNIVQILVYLIRYLAIPEIENEKW